MPSDRVIVPRSLAFAPPVAVSVPVAGTGGHADAHAPEQADMFMPSLAHRYTVRPDPLVRNAPAEPAWVVITVPVVDALAELPAAGAELAGAEGDGGGAAARRRRQHRRQRNTQFDRHRHPGQ